MIGSVVGNYKIIDKIGEGGMGVRGATAVGQLGMRFEVVVDEHVDFGQLVLYGCHGGSSSEESRCLFT